MQPTLPPLAVEFDQIVVPISTIHLKDRHFDSSDLHDIKGYAYNPAIPAKARPLQNHARRQHVPPLPLDETFAKRQGFPRSRGKCPKDKGGSRNDRRRQYPSTRVVQSSLSARPSQNQVRRWDESPLPARRERARVRVTGVDKREGVR